MHSKRAKHFFSQRWKNKLNTDSSYTVKHPTPPPGCVLSSRGTHSQQHTEGWHRWSNSPLFTCEHKKVCIRTQQTLVIICGIPHKSGSKRDFFKNVVYATINILRSNREKSRERAGVREEQQPGIHFLRPLMELEMDFCIRTMRVSPRRMWFCIMIKKYFWSMPLCLIPGWGRKQIKVMKLEKGIYWNQQ